MGNCTGSNRSKERLNMSEQEIDLKADYNKKYGCDPPSDITTTSPMLDNGDTMLKLNRDAKGPLCRIPVLKDSVNRNSPLKHSKNSYKSVLFDRSTNTRIPVTNANVECRKSVSMLAVDNDINKPPFYESGFVSDLSVTASTYSQTNNESKVTEPNNRDESEVVTVKFRKPMDTLAQVTIQDRIMESASSINKDNISTIKVLLPELVQRRSSKTPTKSISTFNVTGKSKRPQSLSTESELILNKVLSKRYTPNSDLLTPLASTHEHSSVMQDVSSLKLMLHKLKRYLTQDGDEGLSDNMNDCLFRLPPSPAADIKSMTREELEHKYELLLEQNVNLEKLLQSREKLIAKLHGEGISSARVHHQSALGDNQESVTPTQGRLEHPNKVGVDNDSYKWSNLKLPQAHI